MNVNNKRSFISSMSKFKYFREFSKIPNFFEKIGDFIEYERSQRKPVVIGVAQNFDIKFEFGDVIARLYAENGVGVFVDKELMGNSKFSNKALHYRKNYNEYVRQVRTSKVKTEKDLEILLEILKNFLHKKQSDTFNIKTEISDNKDSPEDKSDKKEKQETITLPTPETKPDKTITIPAERKELTLPVPEVIKIKNPNMKSHNPNVDEFLKIYSQSLISTGKTRGYDEQTYIETKLDKELLPKIFTGNVKLVILTGNAGDGKTAFIQRIENLAKHKKADFKLETDNGCLFVLEGYEYETLYDGSQDFEGKSNEDLLTSFFEKYKGDKEPKEKFVKIIAINEGKLRDFITSRRGYRWLSDNIIKYLDEEIYSLPESLIFINLNLRSVVDGDGNAESIYDLILNNFLDLDGSKKLWEDCQPDKCEYSDKCYIKYNIDMMRDNTKLIGVNTVGKEIRNRLKHLILGVHLKKIKHITIRDLRSVLSYILFNKYNCADIQSNIDADKNLIGRFYYNNVFNENEKDRIKEILNDLDVSKVSNPKLDNFIYFTSPESHTFNSLLNQSQSIVKMDSRYLLKLFNHKPEGTEDSDEKKKEIAKLYHKSVRRKIFFEGNSEKMSSNYLINWDDLLPYKNFKVFNNVLLICKDELSKVRNLLTLAISKSERIYNDTVGAENLCLRTYNTRKSLTKAFFGFTPADFEVVVKDIGNQERYIEFYPNSIVFRHSDNSAELEISIDLFEILIRIKDGYVPTSSEIRTFFLNLDMFKRRVTSKLSNCIFLTEDDTNLFKLEKTTTNKLVLSKN